MSTDLFLFIFNVYLVNLKFYFVCVYLNAYLVNLFVSVLTVNDQLVSFSLWVSLTGSLPGVTPSLYVAETPSFPVTVWNVSEFFLIHFLSSFKTNDYNYIASPSYVYNHYTLHVAVQSTTMARNVQN